MIHELRLYTLAPGKVGEYLALQRQLARPIRGDRFGRLIEYWTAASGEPHRVVHIWEYRTFEERLRLRTEMAADPRWKNDYSPLSHPLIVRQENMLLLPADLPERAGQNGGAGVESELCFMRLRPGGAPRYLAALRELPPSSPQRPSRAWTVEVGELNTVVGLFHVKSGATIFAEGTLSTFVLRLHATELSPSEGGSDTPQP